MAFPGPDATIVITAAAEPESFLVEVRLRTATRHRVIVAPAYLAEHGLEGVPAERVLREAFAFLLEREQNTSILSRFDLREIERYFPEFREDIERRVNAW